ncbi:putative pectinesterase 67 [Turnera subulata]|uniref:Pectinesterase n=1 Tax=Turnera subulata TaxID=218843 RepID=A0A9Q0JQI6_9ROSI|nr:putative pectinesterase 67 [Turnera subulata]
MTLKAIYVPLAIILVIAITFPGHVCGLSAETIINSPLLTQKIGSNRTIKVDINGDGDYSSIQAAVNAVPDGNSQWVIIHLRKGIYRESVTIPATKPYIFLRGNGRGRTAIVWAKSSSDNVASATFKVYAEHFIAFGITFKNEAPTGVAFTSQNQSVAALVAGEQNAFYHCGFYSTHNTLFDYKGKHYYDHCYVHGSIDFIFGRARSIFYKCELFVIADMRVKIHGSITAHNRVKHDNSGYVFIGGKVYGIGGVYLGRAKGPYSRVVFAKTYLSKTVVPEGWTNWSYEGTTEHIYQAEYKNYGPGSPTEHRVSWAKQLDEKEAAYFLTIDYIDGKEWLPAVPDIEM